MIIKKISTNAVILICIALLMGSYGCQDTEPELDTYGTLPNFSLVDQNGHGFSKSDIEGKLVLANFVFTSCTQFCPVLTPRFAEIQNLIVASEKLSDRVMLLSFSVDPDHDSIDVLSEYSRRYEVDYDHWRFLTGDPEQIRSIISHGFMLSFQKLNKSFNHIHDDGSVHVHGYDIAHTNKVALVDGSGNIRAFYSGTDFGDESDWNVGRVISDLEYLER